MKVEKAHTLSTHSQRIDLFKKENICNACVVFTKSLDFQDENLKNYFHSPNPVPCWENKKAAGKKMLVVHFVPHVSLISINAIVLVWDNADKTVQQNA